MKPMREMQTPLLYALLAAGLAVSWQGLYWINGGSALASPGQAVLTLGSMMQTSEFWLHALETGKALLYALLIGLVGGLAAGLLLEVVPASQGLSLCGMVLSLLFGFAAWRLRRLRAYG